MWILNGIQSTTHFIDFFVVQSKPFIGSFVHVILTRQTCGQRSSRAAESKRRALGNYFSERICYMFLISKFRGDRDLGLCTTSVLAFGEPQGSGTIQKKKRVSTQDKSDFAIAQRFSKRKYRSTDLDLGLFYISILGTYSKFSRKKQFPSARRSSLLSAALLERWPQFCRVKITFTTLPTNGFVSTTKKIDEMRCKLDSTENPRSFEKYPTPPAIQAIPTISFQ